MKDLVIGTIHNYGWDKVRPYAVSLARSGYSGHKVIFALDIQDDARKNLLAMGFEIVDVNFNWDHWHVFGHKRVLDPANYLRDHIGDFRYVMWTDVSDLVFQTNPSTWLEQNAPAPCIVAADIGGWKIRDGNQEDEAARLGPSWLRDQVSCCWGTVAGDAKSMLAMMDHVAQCPNKLFWDEAQFNYLLRIPEFKDITRIPGPDGAWTATVAWMFETRDCFRKSTPWPVWPRMDVDRGLVVTPSGVPYAIVHQWNRSQQWTDIICNKYR